MTRLFRTFIFICTIVVSLQFVAGPAAAYIGPGGGLSYLATALAMLAAFAASAIYVVSSWMRALKSWLRRRGKRKTNDIDARGKDEKERK